MAGFPAMTWELCDRADQSVLATLTDRTAGARVDVQRNQPRAAQLGLSLDDPAAALVAEGSTLIRCKVAGWPDPLFVGRVTQEGINYDDDTETLVINALDPWVQLQRAIILVNGVMPAGIRSFAKFNQDQVKTISDLISGTTANSHGIVMMASPPAGPVGAGTIVDDASIGSHAWTNPGFAKVDDSVPASADIAGSGSSPTHYLKATNFGFNIPAAATVVGISVEVQKWTTLDPAAANIVTDHTLKLLKAGAIVGSNKADTTHEWPNSQSAAIYGNSADLWGTTWTPSDINGANFGLVFAGYDQFAVTGAGATLFVDYVRIIVYWTYPGGSGEIYFTPAVKALSLPAGSSVGDAINNLVGLIGAPEYELTPKEASDGTLATMNAYVPRQGSDKSSTVTLKIGVDATDNLTALSYVPAMDGMINRHTAIGDVSGTVSSGGLDYPTHPAYQASHAASIATYGVWETSEALSGTTDSALLEQSARAIVAANAFPLTSFSCTLDPESAPGFGPADTFWMGDTITLHAELPQESLVITGRVVAATITEDANGEGAVVISCEPESVAGGVSGSTLQVVVDSADGQVPPPVDNSGSDDPCAPAAPSGPDPCLKAQKKKHKKKKKK